MTPEMNELMARLAEARLAYQDMAAGHAGLGGFNVSMANRFDCMLQRMQEPQQSTQDCDVENDEVQHV